MNVLSLCDGMSCLQIAMKELGVKVDKYYASEIDKFAIKQTQYNFPNTIQIGSIIDIDVSKLDKIDFIGAGTPCTNFSFAGKRKGMSTNENEEIYTLERYLELKEQGFEFEGESYLFWEFMRILKDVQKYNPDVLFLLENVEMGKKWERVLSEAVGIYGVHINSALVSAQNRKRIYWTNIRTKQEGLFGELYTDIPQPEDMSILLRDILEEEVDSKYFLSEKIIAGFKKHAERHAQKNTGFGWKIEDGTNKAHALRANAALSPTDNIIKIDRRGCLKRDQDKASCFTTGAHSGRNHSDMDLICVAQRGRDVSCLSPKRTEYGKQIRKEYEAGILKEKRKNIQRLEPRSDGKTNTITSVQKDNLIMGCDYRRDEGLRIRGEKTGTLLGRARMDESCGQMVLQVTPSVERGEMVKRSLRAEKAMTIDASYYKGFGIRGNSCRQLAESNKRGEIFIRRLTPTECARLQTIPAWYEWIVSDSQAYKMIGNGWTIEVIKHILKYMQS